MTIDIYAADEQRDYPIDLERWVALANGALVDEGVRGLAEVSLIFSDVVGDNMEFIASGPTVKDVTTMADASAVLEKVAAN